MHIRIIYIVFGLGWVTQLSQSFVPTTTNRLLYTSHNWNKRPRCHQPRCNTHLDIDPIPPPHHNQTILLPGYSEPKEPSTKNPSSSPIHLLTKNSGFYIGIPLTVLSIIFTYHHYHEFILDGKLVAFNFLVGMYTYGNDRLQDALQWNLEGNMTSLSTKKYAMYSHLIQHQDVYRKLYNLCYDACILLLFQEGSAIGFHSIFFYFIYELVKYNHQLEQYSFLGAMDGIKHMLRILYILLGSGMLQSHVFDHDFLVLPFLIALDSTRSYRSFKVAHPLWKPVYVGAMWASVMVLLPSVLHDNSYRILIEDPAAVLSPFLLMTGSSNMLDIQDIEEDRALGVNTFPVVFGKTAAEILGFLCYFQALLFFLYHH